MQVLVSGIRLFYGAVSVSSYIKTFSVALGLTLAGAASVQAAQLTPEERQICDSLRMCVDIIRRHD